MVAFAKTASRLIFANEKIVWVTTFANEKIAWVTTFANE